MRPQELQKRLQDQVAASPDSVKDALSTARGLRAFLQTVDKLTPDELELIVEQAIALLEGFYVHLPFKRAMHGIDPLRRLRLLQRRLPNIQSEIAFHKEMTEIFTSLRDLHTNYVLPSHFARMVAFLPFRVESWFDQHGPHYIVSMLAHGFSHATFVPGVELRYYNGIPMDRAIEIAAEYHAGSNPAARRARGIAGLTMRAMNIAPPPDEEWAVIGYTTLAGVEDEIKLEWGITNLPTELEHTSPTALDEAVASAIGLDLEGDTFRRLDRMLFSPELISASRNLASFRASARQMKAPPVVFESAGSAGENMRQQRVDREISEYAHAAAAAVGGTDSTMPLVFSARPVAIGARQVAHVRIHTFMVDDDDQFVNEFIRLITLPSMPKDGLIIDVRGNGGGLIWAGERLLQLLTPRTIEPCRAQFISTPQNVELCRQVSMLRRWQPSLERALATGAPYSAAFPITPPERCNDIGQRYYGPVVLITDARCYSTTDIFAAGFRDHRIGSILGTDQNMGAGGANVWTLDQIRGFSGAAAPLKSLPRGAGMRVAIRRTLRVGEEAGTEMEDLGITPDEVHPMTKDDVLKGNPDLLAHAEQMLVKSLNGVPARAFDVTSAFTGPQAAIDVACTRVDYFEVIVDGRSQGSHDVVNDAARITVVANPGSRVELRGFLGTGEHVCSRRLTV